MSPIRARVSLSLARAPTRALPMVLAGHQRRLQVGDRVDIRVGRGWPHDRLADVVTGAGFVVDRLATGGPHDELVVRATRARTLADTVAPRLRLLVVGLNPSLYSADAGIAFARPGNRFWPAALAAGMASEDRDPDHALRHHALGMTDLVKRATPRADALTAAEYRAGVARVSRTADWMGTGAICFVGLAGWRAAVDRQAVAGVQPSPVGRTAVYVMPSTSGVNANASLAQLTDHLLAAAALADGVATPDDGRPVTPATDDGGG